MAYPVQDGMHCFTHYEADDLVVRQGGGTLRDRVVYRVTGFAPPLQGETCGVVFVKGRAWGQSAENVRLATDEEIQEWEGN